MDTRYQVTEHRGSHDNKSTGAHLNAFFVTSWLLCLNAWQIFHAVSFFSYTEWVSSNAPDCASASLGMVFVIKHGAWERLNQKWRELSAVSLLRFSGPLSGHYFQLKACGLWFYSSMAVERGAKKGWAYAHHNQHVKRLSVCGARDSWLFVCSRPQIRHHRQRAYINLLWAARRWLLNECKVLVRLWIASFEWVGLNIRPVEESKNFLRLDWTGIFAMEIWSNVILMKGYYGKFLYLQLRLIGLIYGIEGENLEISLPVT